MVRRSKEDALATRNSLLDAAERVFQAKGVSSTSLHDIAAEAGTTRGAIYWHFKDKADLFNAMMERVTLPMEHSLCHAAFAEAPDPLPLVRRSMREALHRTATDPQTRRVFEVATHKVEYVDTMGAVRQRHLAVRTECLAMLGETLERSARHRGITLPMPAHLCAHGLHALIDGLIQNWLLDSKSFSLEQAGGPLIDVYLAGLGLTVTENAPELIAV